MEGESLPTRTYNHVAFKISYADYPACLARVRAPGLHVREGRSRVEGEGRSIYFYDVDNHLFEPHTGTLAERLARYALKKDWQPTKACHPGEGRVLDQQPVSALKV